MIFDGSVYCFDSEGPVPSWYTVYPIKIIMKFWGSSTPTGCWVWVSWCKEASSWINIYKEISCCRGPQSIREGASFYWYRGLALLFDVVPFLDGSNVVFMQRRRDRINEKMRALQELIPRCNKVGFRIWIYSWAWRDYFLNRMLHSNGCSTSILLPMFLAICIAVRQSFYVGWSHWVLEVTPIASAGILSTFFHSFYLMVLLLPFFLLYNSNVKEA